MGKKLNSLAHYGVKEKALVSLVPKQIDSPSHHIYQAVSAVGRGDPVYSTSPVHSTYDGRTVYNYPTNPANYPMHAGSSPQPKLCHPAWSGVLARVWSGHDGWQPVPPRQAGPPTEYPYSCKPGPVTQVNPRNLPNPIIINKRNRAEVCG